jgi:hypothetical protein
MSYIRPLEPMEPPTPTWLLGPPNNPYEWRQGPIPTLPPISIPMISGDEGRDLPLLHPPRPPGPPAQNNFITTKQFQSREQNLRDLGLLRNPGELIDEPDTAKLRQAVKRWERRYRPQYNSLSSGQGHSRAQERIAELIIHAVKSYNEVLIVWEGRG